MDINRKINSFKVHISGCVEKQVVLNYTDFNNGTLGELIEIDAFVPNYAGTAVSVLSLLKVVQPSKECTHVIFHADDEFKATIPFAELDQAFLLFKQNDVPLEKGFPLRLLIPNGWSECLNVKSVATIEFVQNVDGEAKSTFGYKNFVQLSEL